MGMDRGCPGQDRSSWTADDIFEVPCGDCGEPVEFFKDDARRYCRSCGASGRRRVRAGAAPAPPRPFFMPSVPPVGMH